MDIKAEVLDYINCNETTGALLLTGPWGCGKSFLIKQIAQELNSEKKAAVAVISLFGLDSISAINRRVKDEYSTFKLGSMGKTAKKVSKGLTTLTKDALGVASAASPETFGLSAASQGLSSVLNYDIISLFEPQNTIGNGEKKRKFVLVFDDLERCGINSEKDLLGAINDFVENKQIKVIIIADEEKISEGEYKEYKEKLVSRTIRMSADYSALIEGIVREYGEVSEGYRDFLVQNLDLIQQVFTESGSLNVRTLKCFLADFERIFAVWSESDIPTENMKWALYTFGAEMFQSKASKEEKPASEKSAITFFAQEQDKQYAYKGRKNSSFSSIRYWVNKGIWDKDLFLAELEGKYSEEVKPPLFRFLRYGFWDLQQQDIDEGLTQAVQLAYDGALSKDDLLSLIGKVHLLREFGISIPLDVEYSKMETGLEKRLVEIINGKTDEPKSRQFLENGDVDRDALSLLKKLEKLEDKIFAAENRATYLDFLSGSDSTSAHLLNHLYVEEFDDDWLMTFITKYEHADNSGKREFARSLLRLEFYSETYSTEDNIQQTKENFRKLVAHLEGAETDDSITAIINRSFASQIKEKMGIGDTINAADDGRH